LHGKKGSLVATDGGWGQKKKGKRGNNDKMIRHLPQLRKNSISSYNKKGKEGGRLMESTILPAQGGNKGDPPRGGGEEKARGPQLKSLLGGPEKRRRGNTGRKGKE